MRVQGQIIYILLLAYVGLGNLSCTKQSSVETLDLATLAGWMVDPMVLARLDLPGAQMASSFDPTGGNEDWNHAVRCDPDGWLVLADLTGPGYVSRFWMTGAREGHRLRFFFDDESDPRIDTTLEGLCGGSAPFLPPLAAYENYAWFSYVPLPYARRLVIKAEPFEEGSTPKLFYQVNYHSLQGLADRVESFPRHPTSEDLTELARVGRQWGEGFQKAEGDAKGVPKNVTAPVGQAAELVSLQGPGVIREFSLCIDPLQTCSALERERALRSMILHIHWDGERHASVKVPLGDFFGMPTYSVAFRSLGFGKVDGRLCSWLPMPFAKEARILVENRGEVPLEMSVGVHVASHDRVAPHLGYLHAIWSHSEDGDGVEPHQVARFSGQGKLVGCLLHVWSDDSSWLVLEGDETIVVGDGTAEAPWRGTGLEDYFNGGWYYQHPLCRPQHGLTMRVPFRTSQYRWHVLDAPAFDDAVSMSFEKGAANVSAGAMESVAFMYLAEPQPVPDIDPGGVWRHTLRVDDVEKVMVDLIGLEELGDMQGARDHLRAWLERWPDHEDGDLLRVRELGYAVVLDGFEAAEQGLRDLAASSTDLRACEQARLLYQFHRGEKNGLLGLYCSGSVTAFLDGKPVGMGGGGESMLVFPVQVEPGPHVLALEAEDGVMPRWIEACLQLRDGSVVGTTPDWRWSRQPVDDRWKTHAFDASGWPMITGSGLRGPPIEPFLTMQPNAFVGMHSQSVAVWGRGAEGRAAGPFAYRSVFDVDAPRSEP